jgi:hypothetical protein
LLGARVAAFGLVVEKVGVIGDTERPDCGRGSRIAPRAPIGFPEVIRHRCPLRGELGQRGQPRSIDGALRLSDASVGQHGRDSDAAAEQPSATTCGGSVPPRIDCGRRHTTPSRSRVTAATPGHDGSTQSRGTPGRTDG